MKLRYCLLLFASFILVVLSSCAPKGISDNQRREMAQATQRMGEEQYRSGQFTAALKNLLEAEKGLPDDPYLQNSLGLAYMAKKRPDLAEIHFKTALKLKPDYTQARNNLGGVYMEQKKWNQAINTFKAVSENLLYPTPEIPLSNLGWVYLHQKMFRQAARYFDQALEIRPGFLNAVHGRASIYLEKHDYKQAFAYVQKHLKIDPGAPILHADLARTYEGLGMLSKAKKAWNIVLGLVPENAPLAIRARAHLKQLD
jgi:type IV pilus assembly protein PilF